MQDEQKAKKLPDYLISIYTRITNSENALTKTQSLYTEIELKTLAMFESRDFDSLFISSIPINTPLTKIEKALEQSQDETLDSTIGLNIYNGDQAAPKVKNENKLQALKIRLKEEQEQRRSKKTYVPTKRIPSQEETKKAKAFLEERERINQDLLHEQHQQKVLIEREKLLKSKCAACGKIPNIFGRCGCS